MMKKFFIIFAFLLQFILSLPNPAAVYCADLNGNLAYAKDAIGNVYGLCKFNQAIIGDWTLYKNTSPVKPKAILEFLQTTTLKNLKSLSTNFCASKGATQLTLTQVSSDSSSSSISICKFDDNSLIGEETLREGVSDPLNASLKTALSQN